jgi:hypothetical protein
MFLWLAGNRLASACLDPNRPRLWQDEITRREATLLPFGAPIASMAGDISRADRNFAMQPFVLNEPMWQAPVPTERQAR